jgi:HSP20 family protein
MAIRTPTSRWMQGLGLPSRIADNSTDDSGYELYEEDDEFVLTINMPGFEREEIEVAWDDGRLNVAAEHTDEDRGRKRTFHRAFRLPKEVEPDDITAQYRNGVLEVRLPILGRDTVSGQRIPVEG